MDALTHTECSLFSAVLRRRSVRTAASSVGMSRDCAMRLIHRLESKNRVRLLAEDGGAPGLTHPARVLLRASLDLHAALDVTRPAPPTTDRTTRIASTLDTPMDVDSLARLDPPLVVDVTDTDVVHAMELFDGGGADAVAVWRVAGGLRPRRDALVVPLFDEDLWVVGRSLPADASRLTDLPRDLTWATTSRQARIVRHLLDLPEGSPRLRVVESPEAHRILVLSGRAVSLVPAGRRERFEGFGLDAVRLDGVTRQAALLVDARSDAARHLEDLQRTYDGDGRRLAPVPDGLEGPRVATATRHTVRLEDATLLRAIGRHGSLNRAATELCLTQPALTRRLRKLEDRVGAHLVVRSAVGSRLTPEAVAMVRGVDSALGRFHAQVSAAIPTVHLGRREAVRSAPPAPPAPARPPSTPVDGRAAREAELQVV